MSADTVGNVVVGLLWIVFAGFFVWMGRKQAAHKARMDAHDEQFVPLGYPPIAAHGPLGDYLFAAIYFVFGLCWMVFG